ncbi:MAG: metallophosphoesterase [Clostridia bacterium]|nr:metallophosphoesterase [Clostridia bacterium]
MKVLVIADEESKFLTEYFAENGLGNIDLILSVGDLPYSYLETIRTKLKKPLFYVKGNHDTYKTGLFDKEFIEWKSVEVSGIRIIGIGCQHRNGHILSEAEMCKKLKRLYQRNKRNTSVDIIISHYPAFGIGDGQDTTHQGYQSIRDFVEKTQPAYFVYGHNHLNYGRTPRTIESNKTKYVNAYEKFIIEI